MDETTAVTLGKPQQPAPRSTSWYKAGPSSIQAHRITRAGSKLLVTRCGVALLRATAVGANAATMRCFECQEADKPLPKLPDHSQGKGGASKRPRKEPEPVTEKGRELRAAYNEKKVKA